jgi:hypothetical protein
MIELFAVSPNSPRGQTSVTSSARTATLLFLPVVLACAGTAWMYAAVDHYKRQTGREFYGLAAQHYSVPDWGMTYHEGGQAIERWTVRVPMAVVLGAFIVALGLTVWREWRKHSCVWFVGCVLWYGLVAVGFLAVTFWVSINVTGWFI